MALVAGGIVEVPGFGPGFDDVDEGADVVGSEFTVGVDHGAVVETAEVVDIEVDVEVRKGVFEFDCPGCM